MNPSLALILCLLFIGYCLRRDLKNTKREDASLWLASLFILNIGGRPPSMWLNPYADQKNLLDTTINIAFLISGFAVYMHRGGRGRAGVSAAFFVFLTFCGFSLIWTESGFLQAGKQYIKLLGMLVMALLVASESNQVVALTKVFRRGAYVLIPFSFLFIKYYPDLGLRYDQWSGQPVYIGAAESKNALGQLCLVIALILVVSVISRWRQGVSVEERSEMRLDMGFAALTIYLLWKYANSATAMLCLILGVAAFMLIGFPIVRRYVGWWLLSTVVIVIMAQIFFGLSGAVAEGLGRDPTLTNRTVIWEALLTKYVVNPWIGAGYDGFWTAQRAAVINLKEGFVIGSSHNGFLEIYLTLGFIGLLVFITVLLSMYRRCRLALESGSPFGPASLAIWITVILYNFAEAGWRGQSLVLLLSLVLAVQRPWTPSREILSEPLRSSVPTAVLRGT